MPPVWPPTSQTLPAIGSYFRALADTGSADRNASDLLRRNPDLRQILTAETPWADDAEEQAERLSQLKTLTDTTTLALQLAPGATRWSTCNGPTVRGDGLPA